ncbi:hypothetical protein LTS10_012154 [Elasticomyces elasticus]|nr:hypothetical protein LTS10_012154 [Elasticomyces elasticus]
MAIRERADGEQQQRVVPRRYAPKTRTGCITCKIRRIKCDEVKPSCKRCTSTGRKCDGYILPEACSERVLPSPSLALCTDTTSNALERRTFDFFRSRTAPSVSGYFNDPVWDRLVLQFCQSEPTVRYAVNAVGALHEERYLRHSARNIGLQVSHVRTSFPTVQYSMALRGLQGLLGAENISLDLVMICILLMAHFEALRESFVPALVHVENAIRLLHSSASIDARKIDPHLVRALMRLDIQGSIYLQARIPGLPFALDSTLPATLHDLTQARDLLNTWVSRLFHFMRVSADEYKFKESEMPAPLEVIAKSHDFVQTFADIDQLLWDFMHKPSLKLTTREQHGLAVLRSRAKCQRITAACCIYAEATMYDAYLADFEEILSICTYIMGSDDADRRLFSVSLDEGLLHPLYFVALHCRDNRVRRGALTYLRRLPTNPGIWHVEAMTRTAQMCVDFEEGWCGKTSPSCSDVPEWGRIHAAGFDGWDLTDVRPTVTAQFRLRPNGMDGEWMNIYQEVEWEGDLHSAVSEVHELTDSLRLLSRVELINERRKDLKQSVGVVEVLSMSPESHRQSLGASARWWDSGLPACALPLGLTETCV